MPDTASPEWGAWMKGARAFGKAIWEAVGERKSPKIVFEHPGEDTLVASPLPTIVECLVRPVGGGCITPR